MSNRKGCPEHQEAIAALAMGILAGEQAATLYRHVNLCDGCRTLYKTLVRQEKHLAACFDQLAETAESAAESVSVRKARPWQIHGLTTSPSRGLGRIMRAVASYPRTAIAAAIIVAATGLFVLSWHAGQDPLASPAHAAYSDVLQQISKARSVRYTYSVQNEGEAEPRLMQQMVLEGGWIRTVLDTGNILIANYALGEELYLDSSKKTARLTHLVQSDRKRLINCVDWIQTLHNRDAAYLGQELLDGILVDVYNLDQPYEKMTVWADPRTNLPARVVRELLPCTDKSIRIPHMELCDDDFLQSGEIPSSDGGWQNVIANVDGAGVRYKRTTTIMSDFAWNIAFDESLFSLKPPHGYSPTVKADYGGAAGGAGTLVEALRFWAEMSSGQFPADINMLGDAKPLLVCKYRGVGTAVEAFRQAAPMMDTILKGMFFAQKLKTEDNWFYAGQTVRLGEADMPLAWWLDKAANTWQVIYGDLHMDNLPAEQPSASQPSLR